MISNNQSILIILILIAFVLQVCYSTLCNSIMNRYIYCLLSSISAAFRAWRTREGVRHTPYLGYGAHPGNLYKVKSKICGLMSIKSFS